MRAGLRDMDRGELRPCERAGTFQSFPRDPRPCVCLSSCHASWCSPPTVMPSACMRRRRSYSFLASRMKSGLNDRRRLAAYSLGVNPRPVGAAGLPGMFGMVSFIAGTFLFTAGGVEHGPPVVADDPGDCFHNLWISYGNHWFPTAECLESAGTIPIGLPPTLTGIQPHPRMVRPCRSGKPPAPWGGSHAEEGSNFRPAVLETAALPTELSAYLWAGGIRTRVPGLNVRCSIPLSYSPAHVHRHDRRICGMRSPSPYGVAEDGVSSTLSIFNRIGTSLHQGPHVGRLGSNQHPLALYHLSYTPDGRRSTRPPMSGRRPPASYAKLGQTAIHEPAAARIRSGDPSTTESSPDRIRIRERFAGGAGLEPATYGSKDHRAANCTTRLYAGLRVHPLAGRHPPARM